MEGCLTTKEIESCSGATTNDQELDDSGCLEEDVQESEVEMRGILIKGYGESRNVGDKWTMLE